MSPTEDDLRASLRRGEGEAPDVDGIVGAAVASRVRRRGVISAVAASVVIVVGVAVAVGVVTGRDDDRPAADGGYSILPVRSDGSSRPATSSARAFSPSPPACPESFPQRLLPGGGSSQFGSGPLFSSDAVSIEVCGYGATGVSIVRTPKSIVLAGRDADDLQQSLENASTTPLPVKCALIRTTDQVRLAFLATTAEGRTMRVITTTLGCNEKTTNGSSVRFGWTPPADLRQQLASVR